MEMNALSEVLILVGLILLILWIVVRIFPPKGINTLYGYRTPRSRKDLESWRHAQKFGNRYLISLAMIYLLIGVVFLFLDTSTWSAAQILGTTVAILLLGFGVLFFMVEKSLKKNFS